jgi:hypothetical protein
VLVMPGLGAVVAGFQTRAGRLGLIVFPLVVLTAVALSRLWSSEPRRRHRGEGMTHGYIGLVLILLMAVILVSSVNGEDVLGLMTKSKTVTNNTFTTATSFGACATKSPVYLNSFERGQGTSAFGNFDTGSTSGGTVTVENAVARHGTYSLKVAKTGTGTTYIQKTFSAGAGQVVVRHGIRLSSLPIASVTQLASVHPNAGNDLDLRYTGATQKLEIGFGVLPGSTASTTVSAGAWSLIEIKVDFSVNPRVAEWRLNGVVVGTVSSSETTSTANSWRGGSTGSADLFTANYDDLILSTTLADYPFGDGAGGLLLPNAMGTSVGSGNFQNNDGTAIDANTYLRLDEVPMNSTTDFVTQTAVSSTSYIEIQMGDTPAATSCLNGVIGVAKLHSGGGGTTNSVKTSVFSSSTETIVALGDSSTNAGEFRTAMVTPSSSPWSKAKIDALIYRFGYGTDVAPPPNWDDLGIEYDVPA